MSTKPAKLSLPVYATKRGKITRLRRALGKHWELYLLFAPVALWYFIFHYIPMGGIVIAFKNFQVLRGIWNSQWVGLANFQRFISSTAFRSTLTNTVAISLMNLAFVFPAPVVFSLLLNEVRLGLVKRFVQTVSYLPHFISWTVCGGLFYMILSPSTGVVNLIVKALGGTAINFMGHAGYFRWVLVASSIWKGIGWGAIVYLAAISGVDEALYEAATIDGANRFGCMLHITLPSIANVVSIMLILQVGNILNVNFEQVFIMISDPVLSTGETLEYYIYRVGMFSTNNFSLAAAVGLFKSIVGFSLILLTNFITNKISEGGGIW